MLIMTGAIMVCFDKTWGAEADRPPNILYIMTDDQVIHLLGCYGSKGFETPNIDRLAAQGVRFTKATFAVSICMPSRASIMLGQYLSQHRCGFDRPTNLSISAEEYSKSYPALLKKNGYYTGFMGKLGFPVAATKDVPHTKIFPHKEKPWFDFFYPYAKNDIPPGYYFLKNKSWGLDSSYKDGKRAYITDVTRDLALHFLDTVPADKPFYLSLHFWEPKADYHPAKAKDEYRERFKDVVFETRPDYVSGANSALPRFLKNWRGTGLHKKKTNTPEKYQNFMRLQAALIYGVDLCIGELVDKLQEQGKLDNTIIIFTSDNGFMIGSHGITGKALLYEDSVQAPLIIFDGRADKSRRGRTCNAMISTVDYAPTILDIAGIKAPDVMQGKSFKPLLEGRDIPWRKAAYMENNFAMFRFTPLDAVGNNTKQRKKTEQGSMRCRGLRSHKWKYISYFDQRPVREELYDLEQDPYELKNLAANPEFSTILKELRSQCLTEYKSVSKTAED